MKRFLLLYLLALSALAPQHRAEPPPGWTCQAPGPGVPEDHACTCHRVDTDPDCDKPPKEDPSCTVFCWPKHCRCPIVCEPKTSR
jgi:hypothetical protein